MLEECDDPTVVHKFCSMLPAFVFEGPCMRKAIQYSFSDRWAMLAYARCPEREELFSGWGELLDLQYEYGGRLQRLAVSSDVDRFRLAFQVALLVEQKTGEARQRWLRHCEEHGCRFVVEDATSVDLATSDRSLIGQAVPASGRSVPSTPAGHLLPIAV
jgi:hypothetical protein